MTFSTGDLHVMPLISCEFCKGEILRFAQVTHTFCDLDIINYRRWIQKYVGGSLIWWKSVQ